MRRLFLSILFCFLPTLAHAVDIESEELVTESTMSVIDESPELNVDVDSLSVAERKLLFNSDPLLSSDLTDEYKPYQASNPSDMPSVIRENPNDALTYSSDIKRMHNVYMAQLDYLRAKVRGLSDAVARSASGSFETQAREGSMLLSIVSNQIDTIYENTAEDLKGFGEFIFMRYEGMAQEGVVIEVEQEDGSHIMYATHPFADEKDYMVFTNDGYDHYTIIAYIPKEMEAINQIINTLIKRASFSEALTDELERIALTKSALMESDVNAVKSPLEASSAIDKALATQSAE